MQQLLYTKDVTVQFEDLDIHFNTLDCKILQLVGDATYKNIVYSNVFPAMVTHRDHDDKKILVGDIIVALRNQGEDKDLVIQINATLSVSSLTDKESASIFCKLIHYLFEWTSSYIKDNSLTDMSGKDLIMPNFHYSTNQCKNAFPD